MTAPVVTRASPLALFIGTLPPLSTPAPSTFLFLCYNIACKFLLLEFGVCDGFLCHTLHRMASKEQSDSHVEEQPHTGGCLVLKYVQMEEELRRERKRIEIATVAATVNARLGRREVVQPNTDRLLQLTEETKILHAAARGSLAEGAATKTPGISPEADRGAMEQGENMEARGGCREETESAHANENERVPPEAVSGAVDEEMLEAVDDETTAARRLAQQTTRRVIKVALGACAKAATEQAKAENAAAVVQKVVAKRAAAELALISGGAARRAAVDKVLADRLAEKEGRGSDRQRPTTLSSAHILQGAFGAASFLRPQQQRERPHPPSRSHPDARSSPRKVKDLKGSMLKDRGRRSESQRKPPH